jgi:hypothetical protein
MVNFIYKLSWLFWIVIIIFFRDYFVGKIIILVMAILLSLIAVVRSINARNAWRPIAEKYHKDLDD